MKNIFFLALSFKFIFLQCIQLQAQERVFPFSFDNKWGIVDENRQEILSPQFDHLNFFLKPREGDVRAVAKVDQYVGLISRDGSWIIAPKMDSIAQMVYQNNYLHIVVKKGRYGIINTEGDKAKWLVKPKYTQITTFKGQEAFLAVATNRKGKGIINGEGKLLVPCQYDDIQIEYGYMDFPIIEVTKDGETSYRDYQGNEKDLAALENEFMNNDYEFFDEEVVMEEMAAGSIPKINYKKGNKGETIIDLQLNPEGGYKSEHEVIVAAEYTVENVKISDSYRPEIVRILLSKNGKYGFMNPKGAIVTPVKFDRMEWGSIHYLCLLHLGEHIGLANYKGEQLLNAVFSNISQMNGSLFEVTHSSGYFGYADYKGQVFLPDYVNLEEQ